MSQWKGIMKCYPLEMRRLRKWFEPKVFVQPKLDGIRCRAVHLSGEWVLVTSGENLITSVPHVGRALNVVLSTISNPEELTNEEGHLELDGELYVHGLPLEQINGICSRKKPDSESERIEFHIFDIPIEGAQFSYRNFKVRELRTVPGIEIVRTITADANEETMTSLLHEMTDYGYEGIVIRNPRGIYERKRSTNVLKFKPGRRDHYVVVDTIEEVSIDGRPKGALGSLVCKSGDGKLFNVGTGFTREQREELWGRRRELVGQSATVRYQQLTAANSVPRHSVFVGMGEEQ